MKGSNEELTAEQHRDIDELTPLLGRQCIFCMDGATYHKGTNPYYVLLEGAGGLYGQNGAGRTEKKSGWTADRCVHWLYLHSFEDTTKKALEHLMSVPGFDQATPTAEYEYAKCMLSRDVLDLRLEVEESPFRSSSRFELQAMAEEHGLALVFTPPHVGKYLNPIGLLWSIVKSRSRALPPQVRTIQSKLIGGLRRNLVKIASEKLILNNIMLPSMKFSLALLNAVFLQENLTYARSKRGKQKPILVSELFQAAVDFGQDVRRGEANENEDKGAMSDGIDIACPVGLAGAVLPQKLKAVPAWVQLQHGFVTQGGVMKLRSRLSAGRCAVEPPAFAEDAFSPGQSCSDDSGGGVSDVPDSGSDIEPGDGLGSADGGGGGGFIGGPGHVVGEVVIISPGFYKVMMANSGTVYELSHVLAQRLRGFEEALSKVKPDGGIEAAMGGVSPVVVVGLVAPAAPPMKQDDDKKRYILRAENKEKLLASRFRCSCKTRTAFHGGEDTACRLYDDQGVLRYPGYGQGLSKDDVAALRGFYPALKKFRCESVFAIVVCFHVRCQLRVLVVKRDVWHFHLCVLRVAW